jgi:hypothetical protein
MGATVKSWRNLSKMACTSTNFGCVAYTCLRTFPWHTRRCQLHTRKWLPSRRSPWWAADHNRRRRGREGQPAVCGSATTPLNLRRPGNHARLPSAWRRPGNTRPPSHRAAASPRRASSQIHQRTLRHKKIEKKCDPMEPHPVPTTEPRSPPRMALVIRIEPRNAKGTLPKKPDKSEISRT